MTEAKPEPAKVKFRKLECPFDLQTIFTLQVDTENLKGVLEFILDHLGEHKQSLGEMNEKLLSKLLQVDKNKDACKANSDDIEKLKQLIKELEAKSVETEEICSELKAEGESNGMNIALANNNINDTKEDFKEWLERHDKEIEELKNKTPVAAPIMPDIKAGDGLDMQQLMSLFASKSPPDNTIKRIYDLETAMQEMNGKLFGLDGVTERIKDLEGRVGKLETRADKSDKKN
jgi:transcription termination factor NusB